MGRREEAALLKLATLKLRFADEHVRAMPEEHAGPGVDLRGQDARAVLDAAAPVVAWFTEREPGARVRSVSLERATGRVLATWTSAGAPDARPQVLRVDAPASGELFDRARAATAAAEPRVAAALARRARPTPTPT